MSRLVRHGFAVIIIDGVDRSQMIWRACGDDSSKESSDDSGERVHDRASRDAWHQLVYNFYFLSV